MKPIIEVQNLSKKYQITAQQQRYLSLRDSLCNIFSFNKNKAKEDFWALKDIDFKIEAGESVGILGKNGAGKSTLLKILSRITPPTKGHVILRGRITSLLEVGTGFHPELSGRENVYFNGSILGLRKAEIDRKFDEIVDFSGVEQFIDTPLKNYSSGMQMRLAFAVAAHLESEILIVDEVLGVGDADFQKKCLSKIRNISKDGRTIIIVSHNINAVLRLSNIGIVLQNGNIVFNGAINKAVDHYTQNSREQRGLEYYFPKKDNIGFSKLYFLNSKKEVTSLFRFGEPFEVVLEIEAHDNASGLCVHVCIDTQNHERICACVSDQVGKEYDVRKGTKNTLSAQFDNLVLHPGTYSLTLVLRKKAEILDTIFNAGIFTVSREPIKEIFPYADNLGFFRLNPKWT
jgi:lipopolysaccharide transport system ATP-binding protein